MHSFFRPSKKVLLTAFFGLAIFLLSSVHAHAATRTIANGGGNYNAAGTWVEGVVPTSADDVVATATSGQLTVNVASAAKTFNMAGYTNTLTMNALLTVSGSVTLVSAMTISGSSGLVVNAVATLTSNGKTWPNALTFAIAGTITMADNWTVAGAFTPTSTVGTTTINGNIITVGGNLVVGTVSSHVATGTTAIIMNGTGTWSGGGQLLNNLTFNTAGTITVSGAVNYRNGTLRYLAGTMVTIGSTLVSSSATTFNTSGMTWNNVQFGGTSITFTISSDLNMSGNLVFNGLTTTTINGAFNINVGGNLSMPAVSVTGGTATIVMNGTGTWSNAGGGTIGNKLTFNTTGTITVSGTVNYRTGPLTYLAGTMVTAGSTLGINSITTLNTSGMTWNNVSFSNNPVTYTLTSDLNASGNVTFTTNSANVINGAFNLNVGGNLTVNGTNLSGTATIVMNGTGTWSGTATLKNNLTFNTSGTITISGTVNYATGTLRYIAGTVVTTNSTLAVGATTTLNTSGMTWNAVALSGTSTITLGSDLNVGGNLTVGGTTLTTTINGAYALNVGGNLTQSGSASIVNGTATIVMNGTGTWSSTSSGTLRTPLVLAGTNTISGSVIYSNNTLTISGTLATTGSTLILGASSVVTIQVAGITFETLTITTAGSVTFNGTNGFTTAIFSSATAGTTITLAASKTYTITGALTLAGSSAAHSSLASSSPGSQAIFTLLSAASQNVSFINATDIDSSGDQMIVDAGGLLSNATNWLLFEVTNVTSSLANGSYKAGQVVPILVTFSEAVTVTGVPQLVLATGTPAVTAVSYTSGSGTATLTFNYTVIAGNTSSDLAYVSISSLEQNGGAIRDVTTGAIDALLTLPAPGASGSLNANKNIRIDTTAPVLTEVTPISTATADATPDYTINTTEAGTMLYGGSCSSSATLFFAGSTTITFNTLAEGTYADCTLTIRDAAQNLSNPLLVPSFTVDTTAPSITSVTSTTANGTYGMGQTIHLSVNFSEAVAVTGLPRLLLETGTIDRYATYASTAGSSLIFDYVVLSGDTTNDLETKDTLLDVNGGTIKDLAGSDADLSLPAGNSLATNKDIVIEAVAPVVSEVTPVPTPSGIAAVSYTFSSTEAGTIAYGGICTSGTTSALVGNNTVSFILPPNPPFTTSVTYDDCTITVTDAAGNVSNTLAITTFVIDTTTPYVSEVTPISTPTADTTPDYTFNTTEAGDVTYGGSCSSSTTNVSAGDTTITLDALADGTYADCTITVTDGVGNVSDPLTVTAFTVQTIQNATQFVVVQPTDTLAGGSTTIRIEARKADDSIDTDYQQDVTVIASGSATGGGLVDIVNGVGTIEISDATPELVTLTLSDTETTGLAISSTATAAFAFSETGNYVFIDSWGSFALPIGLDIDPSGFLYIADVFNNRIQKFTPTGDFVSMWGTSGNGNGEFSIPFDVAINAAGEIFVLDRNNYRVQKFDASGSYMAQWGTSGSGEGEFAIAFGLAVDASGAVYVADTNNHRIQKFDSNGNFLSAFGTFGSGNGQLYFPSDVTIDSSGNVYVVDQYNNRIQKFNSSGSYVLQWGSYGILPGELNYPYSIDMDAAGYVYVADSNNHRIQKFSATGGFVTAWGSAGAGDGQFNHPYGITVDRVGYVYVADSDNSRIQKFAPTPAAPGATKFVIINPADAVIGENASITIQAQKSDDSIDTNFNQDVTLVVSGSATGAGLVDIVNGVGTIVITDAVSETVALTLSDTESAGLDVSSTADIFFSSGPIEAVQFIIIDPADGIAGSPVTVTIEARKNDATIDTNFQSDVTLAASGSATGGGLVDIINGVGTIEITDAVAETVTLTLVDSETTGLNVSSTQEVVFVPSAALVSKFVLLDPEDGITRRPITVTIQAQKTDDTVDGTYQQDVTVFVSGSATGAGLVDIVNGVGTIVITDAVAETVTLLLVDTEGTGLDISSTQTVLFRRGGGGVQTLPTLVKFSGRAYPDATLTIVTKDKDQLQDVLVKTDIVKNRDGVFAITFDELPLKMQKTYSLAISDADGRPTQTKFYTLDIVPEKTAEKKIFAAPTITIKRDVIAKGKPVEVEGYVTPGSQLEFELDGKALAARPSLESGGVYYLSLDASVLALGGHTIRARQVDYAGTTSDYSLTGTFTVSDYVPETDLNGDGIVNISDWSIFLLLWGSDDVEGRRAIDFNRDRKINLSDLSIFIQTMR